MSNTLQRARELYDLGLTLRAACEELGVCFDYTRRLLKATGWQPRPAGWHLRLSEKRVDEIERLLARNTTLADVRAITGVSVDAIARLIRERRIERQTVGRTSAPMRRVFLYGPGDEPTQRWCTACERYEPLFVFVRNRSRKHGVGNVCRKSNAARFRARRQRATPSELESSTVLDASLRGNME